MQSAGHLLDTIVRFHDVARLNELSRAVFSLVGQSYRPLHVHVVLQRFSPCEEARVAAALAPLFAIADAPQLSIHNYTAPRPADARSALINMGLAAARGRYCAILDYDDTLYPEAYSRLVARLQQGGARIAFGGIMVRRLKTYGRVPFVIEKSRPFSGQSLVDEFRGNFCPIHSFVFDRYQLGKDELTFEEQLVRNEDYDFLLRVCAGGPSDFTSLNTMIGDYYWKDDGSNTLLILNPEANEENRRLCEEAERFLEWRRTVTPVAVDVQRAAGLASPVPGLTIRRLLDRLDGAPVTQGQTAAEVVAEGCAVA